MTGSGFDRAAASALALVETVAGDVGSATADSLAEAVAACGRVRSRVAAAEAVCLAEVRRRKGDAAAVLASQQRASSRQAAAAVKRSKLLEQLPEVGTALATGAIDADHVDAFTKVRKEHGSALAADTASLLADAANVDADQFRQRLRRWQLEQERKSGESEFDRQRKARSGSTSTRADDGMGIFRFELDPIAAARARAALAQRAEQFWRDDNAGPKATRRSSTQRLADAFEELVCSGSSGTSGTDGVDTTIMIIADLETLQGGLNGRCELPDGTPLPVDRVRELALRARLLPAIFDTTGQPLWLGRSARLPNTALRAAIAARDRGCSVPGCDIPTEWCQIHHILWWCRGGPTDLDNLTTVCSNHHHMIHDDGWHIGRQADGTVTWRGPP